MKAPSLKGCFVGALVSSILFVLAKILVGSYIASTPVLTLFGAAGLILVLLIWIYVWALLIYYGAAVAGLYDKINFVKPTNK